MLRGKPAKGERVRIQPPRSEEQTRLVELAKSLIPGGTTNSIVPPAGQEFLIERGEGAYVFDVDGRRYLDFLMGAGPLVLGHAHPRILETIARTASKGTHHFGLNRRAVELADRVSKYIPSAEMVRFTSTGSEATFHALRLARAVTGRNAYIKFDGAYHGHHDLAVWSFEKSASEPPRGTPESAGIQRGVAEDICVLPFNDSKSVRDEMRANPERYAAVICEPFQRTLSPAPGFLETLREECDRAGVVLIFDEVVTGFRFAPGSAQQRYGVVPDLTALGKALSGGLPVAMLVGRRHLMRHFEPGSNEDQYSFHCGTLNGNLLATECAHTALDILMEEGGIAQLEELGQMAREQMARALTDAGIQFQMCGESAIFHPYFTDRPVSNNADVRSSNWQFNDAFHLKLLEAGIYKTFTKGYVSLAHDSGHLEELGRASKWAAREVKST